MKKNLRNILALSLALMTTVSFAQDWNVDSRTRIDMSGAGDEMSTDQRATVGATWGGSDWGIHVSSDVSYTFEDGTEATGLSANVYEAYASTDVMGYASVTMGRQALDFGSGAIMSSNQWGATRSTWDGFNIGLDLDMADITLGYGKVSNSVYDGVTAVAADTAAGTAAVAGVAAGNTNMWLNASKGDGDWTANLLYMSSSVGAGDAMTAMGLDLGYAMMGGDLNLDVSYNTTSDGTTDGDMTSIGATYNVNESMSITGNQTAYGENGFNAGSASMTGGYLATGNLGYLNADDKDMNVGITYAMGDFNLGATMHQITNDVSLAADRDVTEIALGYTMSDNANLSLSMVTDNDGTETNWMWVTLNIRP